MMTARMPKIWPSPYANRSGAGLPPDLDADDEYFLFTHESETRFPIGAISRP